MATVTVDTCSVTFFLLHSWTVSGLHPSRVNQIFHSRSWKTDFSGVFQCLGVFGGKCFRFFLWFYALNWRKLLPGGSWKRASLTPPQIRANTILLPLRNNFLVESLNVSKEKRMDRSFSAGLDSPERRNRDSLFEFFFICFHRKHKRKMTQKSSHKHRRGRRPTLSLSIAIGRFGESRNFRRRRGRS